MSAQAKAELLAARALAKSAEEKARVRQLDPMLADVLNQVHAKTGIKAVTVEDASGNVVFSRGQFDQTKIKPGS